MPAIEQAARHGLAHAAKTDKSGFHFESPPTRVPDAMQHVVLHRRSGTLTSSALCDDPGSAAHRFTLRYTLGKR
jgi:hypothetical protein